MPGVVIVDLSCRCHGIWSLQVCLTSENVKVSETPFAVFSKMKFSNYCDFSYLKQCHVVVLTIDRRVGGPPTLGQTISVWRVGFIKLI